MDDHATQALGLAHDLSGLGSSEDYYATALARLHELFPCDQAFWTQTDFAHGRVVVHGDETCTDQLALTLGQFGADHPGILSYVAQPTDLTPRRISDVVEQRHWHGCSAYAEVFSEFGSAHQLSMVTGVFSSHVGVGWTFTRSGGDFTESDVDLATYVLPVLDRPRARPRCPAQRRGADPQPKASLDRPRATSTPKPRHRLDSSGHCSPFRHHRADRAQTPDGDLQQARMSRPPARRCPCQAGGDLALDTGEGEPRWTPRQPGQRALIGAVVGSPRPAS